ncbi:MAG: formate dehydrogenase accessory sulfurtransferase FdhD, partial [Gemmatimonadales bacterium]
MSDPSTPSTPERAIKRGGRMSEQAAVEEVPVWLEVNGAPVVTWMCTPDLLEELVIGWLAGEGYIEGIDQVHLRPCATDLGFWAEIAPERVARVRAANRRPVLASGCGAVNQYVVEPVAVPVEPLRGVPPPVERLRALFKALFARGERYRDTGGIHAAALTDGNELLAHAEDIGRHNAVDKVIGAMLLSRRVLPGLGLLVTGRISAELAAKAGQSGLAWIATPSVPSTMAVEIARRSGMVLVGRAVSGSPHVHG